jgi:hypothetical protein
VTLRTRRALLHGLYLGLSLLFASRFFPITHPTSFAITDGDPALMVWTLQWVSRALVHDPLQVFAGNTFFPYAHSIVLTDSMVTLAVANAPVRLFTSNPWVGHDLLIVAAYYLSCVFGSALARELTQSEAAAVWGGIFWGFLFYRVHHIGHLQILSFQFIPAAMLALLRFWRAPGAGRALLLVLAFVAQALVSWYLAVITVVILLVVLVFRPWSEIAQWSRAKYYLPVVIVSAAVILPLARPYRAAFEDSTLADRRALINTFGDAVRPADYFTPPDATLAGRLVPKNPYWIWGENTLYVGFVPLFLAMTGLASTLRWTKSAVVSDGPAEAGRNARTVITGIALVAVGYVLALGFVSPRLGIHLPLNYVARAFPMVAGLRATQRFSLVLYAGVLVLSTLGLSAIVANRPGWWRALATTIACAAFLLEVFPFTLPVHADNPYNVSAPDRAIADYQRSRATPLVVLHLPINYFREPYPVSEAVYMLDSTDHWARILNGFSGGVPQGFMERMTRLNTLPADGAVRLLFDLGVDVVAVHRGTAQRAALVAYFERQPWASIKPVGGDEFVVLIDRTKSR